MNLLVLDDDGLVREAIEQALRNRYRVLTATLLSDGTVPAVGQLIRRDIFRPPKEVKLRIVTCPISMSWLDYVRHCRTYEVEHAT